MYKLNTVRNVWINEGHTFLNCENQGRYDIVYPYEIRGTKGSYFFMQISYHKKSNESLGYIGSKIVNIDKLFYIRLNF